MVNIFGARAVHTYRKKVSAGAAHVDLDCFPVTHRPVIDRKPGKDISQEPEMKELVRVFRDMTEGEKGRTLDHLGKREHLPTRLNCQNETGEGEERPLGRVRNFPKNQSLE